MKRRLGLASIVSVVMLLGFLAIQPIAAGRSSRVQPNARVSFHDVTILGDARLIDGRLRLTSSDTSQVGGGWITEQRPVASGFRATFTFRLKHMTDGGSDGFAFVIQNDSLAALGPGPRGGTGQELGYDGIPNSLAVEFDTYSNGDYHDPLSDHVSVHTLGTLPNSADEQASLGAADVPALGDGLTHRVVIKYRAHRLTVHFDGVRILLVQVQLDTTLTLNEGAAWVGFTGATGGGSQEHWINRLNYRAS